MKKRMMILSLLLLPFATMACDICGCGANSYYAGILPEFRKRFVGLRYQYKSLWSHIAVDGSHSYLTTHELFSMAEVWGAFNIGKRWRVMGFVPYNNVVRYNQGKRYYKQGLGDVIAAAYYRLLNSKQQLRNGNLLLQSLWMGAGIKLPTGRYDVPGRDMLQNLQNSFQLGTGSTDFSAYVVYDLRLQDWGINVNGSYKLNTANRDYYRYGDKLTANLLAYRKFRVARVLTLAPNAGVMLESARPDRKTADKIVAESGGQVRLGIAGLEASIGRISAGGNFQIPISTRFNGFGMRANNRLMVHVAIAF